MPLNPAIITSGASVLGQGINALSNIGVNKATRKWNEKMYNLQRQHSLADWTMQNEYNSPQSQMERLKAAKLNPNLIYGDGSVAGNSSSNVRGVEAKSWNPQAPQVDLGDAARIGFASYFDWEMKKAQTDNIKAQNTVILQDALLKAAQTYATAATGDKTSIEASFAKDNYLTSLEAAKANLDKTIASTKVMLDENERRAAMQSPNLQIAAEKILTMRLERARTAAETKRILAMIENIKQDTRIKTYDANLKQLGIQPKDPLWQRALSQILGSLTDAELLGPASEPGGILHKAGSALQ